ncbi:MAG: hypothetical protein U5M50_12330 [Sphingobium sp.]|nr:hypothetical protein [Sphingobium sp.]
MADAAMGLRGQVWHGLGQQLRNPTGWAGRLVGRMMRIANRRPTVRLLWMRWRSVRATGCSTWVAGRDRPFA